MDNSIQSPWDGDQTNSENTVPPLAETGMDQGGRVRFGDFEFWPVRRELRQDGRLVNVGRRGLDLLAALLAAPGQPVSKADLIASAWGVREVESSNLTVQITALRRRLDGSSELGQPSIRTVPGFGYLFTPVVERVPAAPPAAPLPAPLPAPGRCAQPLTRFIGREAERRDVARLLSANRLVTLTGIGGVGKTRLSLHLCDELAGSFRDGLTFIDLAPLERDDEVAAAVADAVAAPSGTGAVAAPSGLPALCAALHRRHQLLILDNAEHLVGATRQVLARLLRECPGLSALVTSRDSLGLPGEAVLRLLPHPLPPAGRPLSAAEAMHSDAVRLFVDRAAALLPAFAIDDGNAPAIVEICRRLDGIALAIELAVPSLEVLDAGQLALRLHDPFAPLARPRHDGPPRQRTLRALFDWSWNLLSAAERRLLQLIAASAGGVTLPVLERLADGEADLHGADVLEHLVRLAQSSLIVASAGSCARHGYTVLHTTRRYTLDRLNEPSSSTGQEL